MTCAVNSSTFTLCAINGQALGTSQGTGGIIGVRVRITTVSSGNTYDLNNGFQVEEGMLNLGSTVAAWRRNSPTYSAELERLQFFYQKSFALGTVPGTATTAGAIYFQSSGAQPYYTIYFKKNMRVSPSYTFYSPSSGTSGDIHDIDGSADVTVSNGSSGGTAIISFQANASITAGHNCDFQWTADSRI